MKKHLVAPIITIIILVLILGLFTYFYFQLNRLDKKTAALQTAGAADAAKITAVVNFFNANLNAQNK